MILALVEYIDDAQRAQEITVGFCIRRLKARSY